MKEIGVEDLKRIQLEILSVVAEFCEKNGIRYWIDSGTLLGAVRYGGYIPWDDDIDVGMLREDYDKFSEAFNKANEKYKFVCYENRKDFYLPHGKVCDSSTVLYEPDENGYKLSVNIDIFVYDNDPDDDEEFKKMYIDLTYGLELDVVFDRLSSRIKLDETKYMASSLVILNKTGGNIVKVFSSIERSFFERKKLNDELKSVTALSSFVFKILVAIPFIIFIMIYILNPSYFAPLVTTIIGKILLIIILLIYVLYIVIVRRLIRIRD